jgi:hypothetical protein
MTSQSATKRAAMIAVAEQYLGTRDPNPECTLPKIMPSVIFAAGRDSFEFLTPGRPSPFEAKRLCFAILPLEENGWDYDTAVVEYLRLDPRGLIWRISKNSSVRPVQSDSIPANGPREAQPTPSIPGLARHPISGAAQ